MNGPRVRCAFPVKRRRAVPVEVPCRAARVLALAHFIERQVEAGELTGYAEAARGLGLTRARLTQVMNLLLLAPEIQGQVLLGRLDWTERRLRHVVRETSWRRQIAILGRPARAARSRVNGLSKAQFTKTDGDAH